MNDPLLAFPLNTVAQLSGIDNLQQLVECGRSIAIAYANGRDEKQKGNMPALQALLERQPSDEGRVFLLSCVRNDERMGFFFAVDADTPRTLAVTRFNAQIDLSDGASSHRVCATRAVDAGNSNYFMENAWSALNISTLRMARAFLADDQTERQDQIDREMAALNATMIPSAEEKRLLTDRIAMPVNLKTQLGWFSHICKMQKSIAEMSKIEFAAWVLGAAEFSERSVHPGVLATTNAFRTAGFTPAAYPV